MTNVIGSVISINTFEEQCFVIKGMLQSPRLKYHVKTTGIDQSLSNNSFFLTQMSSKHQENIQT